MTDTHASEPTIRLDKQRLEAMLQMRGISRNELARRLGLHHNTMHKVASTGNTSFETLTRMAIALECNPIDLLVTDGFPDPFWASNE